MTSARIPHGCITIKDAAQEMGVGSRTLYKKMRVIGWLNIDRKGELKGYNHNTPKQWAIKEGYVIGVDYSYTLKGAVPIEKTTTNPVLTLKGFETLEGIIKRGEEPPQEIKQKQNTVTTLTKPTKALPKEEGSKLFKNLLKELNA